VNSGAGSAIPPKGADAAAEHATLAASSSSSLSLPLGAAMFGLLVIGAIGARRWWTGAHAKREPEGPAAP
jgi:hypothetical protein